MNLSSLPGAVRAGLGGLRSTAAATLRQPFGSSTDDPIDERDQNFIKSTLPLYHELVRRYFRADVRGLEHIPARGPVLLVGNHSGGFYIVDTFAFVYAFYSHFSPKRALHPLSHEVALKLPALSTVLRKYGGLPAAHESAEKAFKRKAAVLVYPGGEVESFRPSTQAGEIDMAGRTGFIRLALAQNVPIVPVVAIGGQETALFVTRGQRMARLLQLDRLTRLKVLPVQIGPPFGLTVLDLPGRLPLPASLTLQVLPKIDLRKRFGDDADEQEVYDALTADMQATLDKLAEERDLPIVGRVWSPPADGP